MQCASFCHCPNAEFEVDACDEKKKKKKKKKRSAQMTRQQAETEKEKVTKRKLQLTFGNDKMDRQ
jgi:hypothetical protein